MYDNSVKAQTILSKMAVMSSLGKKILIQYTPFLGDLYPKNVYLWNPKDNLFHYDADTYYP